VVGVIIGVMSDTHGNTRLMRRVADMMGAEFGAEVIFHLGDDYGDGAELAAMGHVVHQVPGLWCKEYHDPHVPRRLVKDLAGVSVACVHSAQDLRHTELAADVILFGHTHEAVLEERGGRLYVNPGHLRTTRSRNSRPSFGVVELGREEIHAAIHELDGQVRAEATMPLRKPG